MELQGLDRLGRRRLEGRLVAELQGLDCLGRRLEGRLGVELQGLDRLGRRLEGRLVVELQGLIALGGGWKVGWLWSCRAWIALGGGWKVGLVRGGRRPVLACVSFNELLVTLVLWNRVVVVMWDTLV